MVFFWTALSTYCFLTFSFAAVVSIKHSDCALGTLLTLQSSDHSVRVDSWCPASLTFIDLRELSLVPHFICSVIRRMAASCRAPVSIESIFFCISYLIPLATLPYVALTKLCCTRRLLLSLSIVCTLLPSLECDSSSARFMSAPSPITRHCTIIYASKEPATPNLIKASEKRNYIKTAWTTIVHSFPPSLLSPLPQSSFLSHDPFHLRFSPDPTLS